MVPSVTTSLPGLQAIKQHNQLVSSLQYIFHCRVIIFSLDAFLLFLSHHSKEYLPDYIWDLSCFCQLTREFSVTWMSPMVAIFTQAPMGRPTNSGIRPT